MLSIALHEWSMTSGRIRPLRQGVDRFKTANLSISDWLLDIPHVIFVIQKSLFITQIRVQLYITAITKI